MDWVDVCNMALDRLGEDPITSLTDEIKTAEACNRNYEQARDEVLQAWNWSSARSRKDLTADTTAPVWGWDYRYALPSNPYCLRLISIEKDYKYTLEGRYILTDKDDGLNILYTKRITDPAELDPFLAKAIALRLASDICRHIVPSTTLKKDILAELEIVVLEAKGIGACQEYNNYENEPSSDTGNAEWITEGR